QSGALAASKYYETRNNRFIWIESLWAADAPWAKAIPDFDTFERNVDSYLGVKDGVYKNAGQLDLKVLGELKKASTYNKVMGVIRSESPPEGADRPNGYLILAVLAIGFSLLSQFITTRQQKRSGQVGTQGNTMKIMMFIMPAMVGVFALMYTASFAVYMITNSVMSLLINLLTTAVLGGISMRKAKEERSDTGVVKYGRRDPNDNIKKK
ncbi:MAG: YidC/Oxa1 family membrane protein insertase, partial [Firmicutes bacterium]|nr:YidC/Oxa1 family membrane protein insertase [Bacillota bacterium]